MKAGLLLLLYLATVCWSAVLPVENGGDVLKRDSEDYTETVTVIAPRPTSKTTSNQGSNVTVTVTETKSTSTVKKTSSSKKGTTTVFGLPTKPVYKTITEIIYQIHDLFIALLPAPPLSPRLSAMNLLRSVLVAAAWRADSGSSWISLEWGSLTLGVNKEKRQIWLDPFTTTDYATPHSTLASWNGVKVTSTITETEEDRLPREIPPSPYHKKIGIKHNFQCQPRYHPLSRIPTFNKRQTFSATLELDGPAETDFLGFYPSETTNGGEDVPYGSGYPLQTWMPS
jgi:hypothetical protein